MPELFPKHTAEWLHRPHPLRHLSMSLPQMALLTGLLLPVWRSFALTHGRPDSWLWVGGTILAGMSFLFVMCALHLGNFTLRTWAWRAPMFAVLEAGTEVVVRLAMTALGLEAIGSETAELSDWLPTAVRVLFSRVVGVSLFALVLAVVVYVLRRIILVADHRTSTAAAIHRASVEHEALAKEEK